MKNRIVLTLLVLTSISCFASNNKEVSADRPFIINETSKSITYIDKFNNETVITKKPKRVVIVYNSILGLWYYTGGSSLTKVKGTTNVPPEAQDLLDLGPANSVSLEAIIAQEPDLVILAANYEMHVSMAPLLKEMGIEVMIIDTSINSYERFKENTLLFSKINGTEDMYESKVSNVINSVESTIAKVSDVKERPKVAAIFATRRSLSLESDIALTGEMVSLLGGYNIIDGEKLLVKGETRISFSIEALITQNPDIILISTMGDVNSVKENIENMIAENPVWNEVNAVKNGRVHFLPKQFSVYKPNELYGDAFLYIAELMYPDIFGL